MSNSSHTPLFSPSRVFRAVLQAVATHLKTLYLVLDTVKDGPPPPPPETEAQKSMRAYAENRSSILKRLAPSLSPDYLLPLLLWAYISAESCYRFWENSFQLYDGSPAMEHLFSHRLFPRDSWQQGDVITTISLVMAIAIYLCLIGRPPLDERLTMYLLVDEVTIDHNNGNSSAASPDSPEDERRRQSVKIIQNNQGKRFMKRFCFQF